MLFICSIFKLLLTKLILPMLFELLNQEILTNSTLETIKGGFIVDDNGGLRTSFIIEDEGEV